MSCSGPPGWSNILCSIPPGFRVRGNVKLHPCAHGWDLVAWHQRANMFGTLVGWQFSFAGVDWIPFGAEISSQGLLDMS